MVVARVACHLGSTTSPSPASGCRFSARVARVPRVHRSTPAHAATPSTVATARPYRMAPPSHGARGRTSRSARTSGRASYASRGPRRRPAARRAGAHANIRPGAHRHRRTCCSWSVPTAVRRRGPGRRFRLGAAGSRRADGLEPAPEPPGDAGPVCFATNVGVLAVQRVDAGQDEPEHRGERCHSRCCAVEDEHREDQKHRDEREGDASAVALWRTCEHSTSAWPGKTTPPRSSCLRSRTPRRVGRPAQGVEGPATVVVR